MSHPASRNDAFWSVITQLFAFIIFFFPLWMVWNLRTAASFAVGGVICVLPNIYLYRRVFRYFGARQAKQIVKALYSGETTKFLLTIAGFTAALFIPWLLPSWMFAGYMVAQFGFWLGPWILAYRQSKKNIQKNIFGTSTR